MAAVSELFDEFVVRSVMLFAGNDVTVDKMLVPFRGRCGLGLVLWLTLKIHFIVIADIYPGGDIKLDYAIRLFELCWDFKKKVYTTQISAK